MTDGLRVGTRRSPLAIAQTELVVRALRRRLPETRFDLVPLVTAGDRARREGPALDFTERIDRELAEGRIDLAVHSSKDLPARLLRPLTIAAFPQRADARDCLVLARHRSFRRLPAGSRLGSSSPRRAAQLRAWRPDLAVVPIRGNVGTRIEQMTRLGLDGVVLAAAGLDRLGWGGRISEYLPVARVLPAPGQGALAVEVRRSDRSLARDVGTIDHRETRAAVTAERAVVAALGGDCDLPLGAYARVRQGRLHLSAAIFTPDGTRRALEERDGTPFEPAGLGRAVGRALDARRRGWADDAGGR